MDHQGPKLDFWGPNSTLRELKPSRMNQHFQKLTPGGLIFDSQRPNGFVHPIEESSWWWQLMTYWQHIFNVNINFALDPKPWREKLTACIHFTSKKHINLTLGISCLFLGWVWVDERRKRINFSIIHDYNLTENFGSVAISLRLATIKKEKGDTKFAHIGGGGGGSNRPQ